MTSTAIKTSPHFLSVGPVDQRIKSKKEKKNVTVFHFLHRLLRNSFFGRYIFHSYWFSDKVPLIPGCFCEQEFTHSFWNLKWERIRKWYRRTHNLDFVCIPYYLTDARTTNYSEIYMLHNSSVQRTETFIIGQPTHHTDTEILSDSVLKLHQLSTPNRTLGDNLYVIEMKMHIVFPD